MSPAQEAMLVGRRDGDHSVQMGRRRKPTADNATLQNESTAFVETPPWPNAFQQPRLGRVCDDQSDRARSVALKDERRVHASLVCDTGGRDDVRPAATPCSVSDGGESHMRMKAVAATIVAPAIAMTSCQYPAGRIRCASPREA